MSLKRFVCVCKDFTSLSVCDEVMKQFPYLNESLTSQARVLDRPV